MKFNSFIAFVLTLTALLMVLGLIAWVFVTNFSKILAKKDYCEHFMVELTPETYFINLEAGKGKLVKVNIKNLGFEDEFKILTDGPKWVTVRPNKIRLNQYESEDIFVYISPAIGSEGNYTVSVIAKSYCGISETKIIAKV